MVDADKNMAIGFSASNWDIYCGAYYSIRHATDSPGFTGPTLTLQHGQDYYTRTFGTPRNRWGDYSGLALCPSDEATFWVYNEYACTRGTPFGGEDGRWCTRLGFFRIEEECYPVSNVRIHNDKTDQWRPHYADLDTLVLGEWDFEPSPSCDPQGWTTVDKSFRGNFASLYPGATIYQEDPCWLTDFEDGHQHPTCLWGFFDATEPYNCHRPSPIPSQGTIPYVQAEGLYSDNEIWSPLIPCTGAGSSFRLEFDVYRDLAWSDLVFYKWRIRSWVGSQPGEWRDKYWLFYSLGLTRDWIRHAEEIGELIEPGATDIQIALGVVDMCGVWCGVWGDGLCHSQSPLLDNVRVVRIDQPGPQWNVRQVDLFQDNFAEDGTGMGLVRADAALDIAPRAIPIIRPGDSVCVWVGDYEAGLATDIHTLTGPAVYCYVSVRPQNQPDKSHLHIEAPESRASVGTRFPFVDVVVEGGATWFCYRMDTVFCDPVFGTPVPDRYCFDLNDGVFTPGDTVYFAFGSQNNVGEWSYWTEFTGQTPDRGEAFSRPMEFTCLPAAGLDGSNDILYVDAFDGRGGQRAFDWSFRMMGLDDVVDRYDERGPSSLANNGLDSRVKLVRSQIIPYYRKIIWNTGDLPAGTIGNGTSEGTAGWPLKTDDFNLLYIFLNEHQSDPGIYFSGDNIAEEWNGFAGGSAATLRATYMNFNLAGAVPGDHRRSGEPSSPLLQGVASGCFDHFTGPDTLIAYGGCPKLNNFDLLQPTGASTAEMTNPSSSANYILSQATVNSANATARVILSGFSYHYIADQAPASPMARAHHLHDIITWLENAVPEPVGIDDTRQLVYYLDNAYPNPFNPVTTIKYGIKERTRVSLKVYDAAGRLVKTLVNEVKSPRVDGFANEWYGDNNAGQQVASGVYFYKLVTKDFTKTKKMVLLK
jgi:hypothetical protein